MRAAILLAAGGSRRFGRRNKLLALFRGRPLLLAGLAAARSAPVHRVIVVTGADRLRVHRAIPRSRGISVVHAPRWGEGISASLKRGIAALRPIERDVFIFLADMPDVPSDLARRLVHALAPGIEVARAAYRGRPGHPVLIRSRFAREAVARGDVGFSAAISALPSDRRIAIAADARAVRDIDRVRDLRNLHQAGAGRGEKTRAIG